MVDLNLSALDTFRKNVFENADAIVTADGQNKKLQQKGAFSNANVLRFIRSSGTKAENNAVRTMLLKSLGETFNIQGMTAHADGKVTFSREFMDKLESLLGKEFKRSDFSVGDDGMVKSGKPLTARRVKAIVGKIDELSRAAKSGQMPVAGKNSQPQMIEMADLGSKSEDQKIPYSLFKKIYSLGTGFVEPQYKNAEEFYAEISKNHKDDLFKPFENLVDKLINKIGEDAVKQAVIDVTGSYDSKTKYSAILPCLMRNDTPTFLGQDDVNVTGLLKYLESRLSHLAVIRDIGGNAVNKADPVNAKAEDNSNNPLNKDLAKDLPFEAGNDSQQFADKFDFAKVQKMNIEKLDNSPMDKEIAKELLFDPHPGAERNSFFKFANNKNFVKINKHVSNELSRLQAQFGNDKIDAMIRKLTGISDRLDDFSRIFALINSLFLKGSDSGNKLESLIGGNATNSDLLNLINERLKELEGYLKDPNTIPNPVPEKVEEVVIIDHNADREYKCSVDMAAYEKYDLLQSGSMLFGEYCDAIKKQTIDYINMPLRGIKSLEDYDNVISLLKNNGDVSQYEKYSNSVRGFLVLQEITNDFIKVYGEDSIKKIVTSAGGEYSENSRPEIELAKVIFTSNPTFQGHYNLLSFGELERYHPNIAGLGNIFIDGLDAHVKKLNMKPINS